MHRHTGPAAVLGAALLTATFAATVGTADPAAAAAAPVPATGSGSVAGGPVPGSAAARPVQPGGRTTPAASVLGDADPQHEAGARRITVPGCAAQPAAAEDLRTARPARLAALGLPPRPVAGPGAAQWQTLVAHARTRHCTVTRVSVPDQPARRSGAGAAAPAARSVTPAGLPICLRSQRSAQPSGIWSGAVAVSGASGPCQMRFDSVFGAWKATADEQSTFSCRFIFCARRLSEWVGLGGWHSSSAPLVQAGLTQQTVSVSRGYDAYPPYWVLQTLTPWAEVYTDDGGGRFKDWMDFSIHPGDMVIAMVWTDATDDTNHFLVEDGTTGDYDTDIGHGFRSDGSSAEWIVERPGGGSWPLLDFGHVHFDIAYAGVGPTTWWLSQTTRFPVTMVNDAGTTLAHASLPTPIGYAPSDSQIDDYWSAPS